MLCNVWSYDFYDITLRHWVTASPYHKIGYNMNVMLQTACMVLNPVIVDNFVSHFNCATVSRTSCIMTALSAICFRIMTPDHCCLWTQRGPTCEFTLFWFLLVTSSLFRYSFVVIFVKLWCFTEVVEGLTWTEHRFNYCAEAELLAMFRENQTSSRSQNSIFVLCMSFIVTVLLCLVVASFSSLCKCWYMLLVQHFT